eukprot:scaffold124436_cov35-Tisochrysis_lutea.AAC.4
MTLAPPGPITLAATACGSRCDTSDSTGGSTFAPPSEGRCSASLTSASAAATCSCVPPTVMVCVSESPAFSLPILMYAPDLSRMLLIVAPPCPMIFPAISLSSSCLSSVRSAWPAADGSGDASSWSTIAIAA